MSIECVTTDGVPYNSDGKVFLLFQTFKHEGLPNTCSEHVPNCLTDLTPFLCIKCVPDTVELQWLEHLWDHEN